MPKQLSFSVRHDHTLIGLFEDEKLANLQGDFRPSNDFTPMSPNTDVVDVPKRDREPPGWFERTLIFLGMEYEER